MTTHSQGSGQDQDGARDLDGLRVLEIGDLIAAPYCTRLMADLGADVIKVEPPTGDTARRWGPFPDDVPDAEGSGLHLYVNLGKRSVTVNVDDPAGQAIIEKLLAWADVLVSNYPARRLESLELDPPSVQSRHSGLVVTTLLPYGWDSPERDYHAYPLNTFVASGVSVRIGEPDRNPLTVPLSVISYIVGVSGAGATLTALRARQTTGRGQHIDIAEADTLTQMYANGISAWQVTGQERGRNGRALMAFNQALYCRDGSMHVIVNDQQRWEGLMDIMGHPEWAQAPEFATMAARRNATAETQDLFEAMTQAWMADYDREDLYLMAREHDITMAPYQNAPEVLDMEQLQVRETLPEVNLFSGGRVRVPVPPYKLSPSPVRYGRAPLLGEHNVEVLCGLLGYERADLPVLRRLGVI